MNDESTVLGIEFGNPSNPIAIAAVYSEQEEKHGIAIYPVLNNDGLKPGDDVAFDRVGDMDFLLIFRTETSINTMIDSLNWIKDRMKEEKEKNNND